MEPVNFEGLIIKKLEDLSQKVDEIRTDHIPQIKLDMQKGISDLQLDMQKSMTSLKVDVGGLQAKAKLVGAIAGGTAGIVGTGFISALLYKLGIR